MNTNTNMNRNTNTTIQILLLLLQVLGNIVYGYRIYRVVVVTAIKIIITLIITI